jgi:alcohol dehydrogenase (cytochrome c)
MKSATLECRRWGLCCLLVAAGSWRPGPFAADSPPPPGADWAGYNKDLDGQRYSPLSQITAANVTTLQEICRVSVAPLGSLQSGLVQIGADLFVTTPTDTLSLDPVTCQIHWRHSYQRAQPPGLSVNRGIAYLNGRVYRGTDDGHLLALDAATGMQLWNSIAGDASLGEYISGAPLAWNGLVIVGIAGGEFGIRGRILAYDALNGREVWRFNTVPDRGEPGADSWGHSAWRAHGGGASWSSFSLDPRSDELFVPVGNPVPDFAAVERPGANLYTDAAVVLDARTGSLRWWYQLQANDDRDYDLAAAPILYRNTHNEEMMAAAGKDGLLHIVARETHTVRSRTAVTTVDPVHAHVSTAPMRACPGPAGGVLWNGPAFDPRHMTLFVGADDLCITLQYTPGSQYKPRGLNLGGTSVPGKDTPTGWLTAIDADTGEVRWRYHADTPVLAGVTPTAGGIVMTGDNAGDLLAFDSDNGQLLLRKPIGGALAGGVITYERGGRQYVALTSGNVSPASFGNIGRPSVVILALPQTAVTAANSTAADADRGRQLYAQVCSGCHGPDGNKIAERNLRSLHLTAVAATAFIDNPPGAMPRIFPPPRTADDERDIRDIAAYLVAWQ